MESFETELRSLIDAVISDKGTKISDIPNIDLYMDQVTTFTENILENYKRNAQDKILTKTMINNYTKDGIIPPPAKKKYSKSHMMILIIVFHLKTILSISDIKKMLDGAKGANSNEDYASLYEIFHTIQMREGENFSQNIFDEIEQIRDYLSDNKVTDAFNFSGESNENDHSLSMLVVAVMLIIKAENSKRLAESIIDKYLGGKG